MKLKKICICLFFFANQLETHEISSHLKNVVFKLGESPNFFVTIEDLNSYDNTFYLTNTKSEFEIYSNIVMIGINKTMLVLNLEKKHTFQIIGYGIDVSYYGIKILSKKIDAYVDIKDIRKLEIKFEKNYLIEYEKLKLESPENLYYTQEKLYGSNISIASEEMQFKIKGKSLEAHPANKFIIMKEIKIAYPKLNVKGTIKEAAYEKEKVILKKIEAETAEFDIKIDEISFKDLNNIKIGKTIIQASNVKIESPYGTASKDSENIKLENITIYFKKLIIKVQTCKITKNNVAQLEKIEIYQEDKKISEAQNGEINFENKTGKINIMNFNI